MKAKRKTWLKMKSWFDIHLSTETARSMTRKEYYEARSYLRRVRHIIGLRYKGATIVRNEPMVIHIPSTENVLPEKFR